MYDGDVITAQLDGLVGNKWRKVWGSYTIEFASIAAAGSGSGNRQIQSDAFGGFVIDTIAADVRIGAAVGGYSSGKITATREPFQSADDTNHLVSLANVFAKIQVNGVQWTYDRIPLTHFTGTGHNPAFFATRPRVRANETIFVDIDNECEIAVAPVISFIGFKLYPVK